MREESIETMETILVYVEVGLALFLLGFCAFCSAAWRGHEELDLQWAAESVREEAWGTASTPGGVLVAGSGRGTHVACNATAWAAAACRS